MGIVLKGNFGTVANEPRAGESRQDYERRWLEANRWYVGDKYEATRDLDCAALAKLIRKDIKAAVLEGELPKAKYGVRISRYAGGRSITTTITGLDFETVNTDRLRAEARDRRGFGNTVETAVGRLMTDEAYEVERKVGALVNAYNFDRGNPWEDYYSNAFADFVKVECDFNAAIERAKAEVEAEEEARELADRIAGFDADAAKVAADEAAAEKTNSQDDWLTYLGVKT